MKAVLVTSFGAPETLRFTDVPPPVLGEGMVRVRVHCIGLNFADVFARMGVYPAIPDPPFIPGIEFAGEVVEKAAGVNGIRKGDRVMGFTRQGAYAEEVCVPAHFVQKIPAVMSDEQGAAFLVTYMSAWHGLRTLGQTGQGETILVHAAAGGVGTACAQLGRHWGCTVIGTASSSEKLAVAREQGATHAFNYTTDPIAETVRRITDGRGVDVVMDSVGGRVMRQSWKVLAPMGRYVLYGFAAVAGSRRLNYLHLVRETLSFPLLMPTSFPSKNVSFMGFNLYFLADRSDLFRSAAGELLALFRKKRIAPVIGRIFPFEEVVQAHTFLQSRKSIGKVLLRVR